jgi:hypothetical protein
MLFQRRGNAEGKCCGEGLMQRESVVEKWSYVEFSTRNIIH